jgi:Glycosyl hydrolase family 14
MVDEMQITLGVSGLINNKFNDNELKVFRAQTAIAKQIKATSVETYVIWSAVENEKNIFDWSHYDKQVEIFIENNIKWVPFLILGPWYATPKWFRESRESVLAKCLEHNENNGCQSIWNPFLKLYVARYLNAFYERYKEFNIIESVLLGISGDFGEAIYPVFGSPKWSKEYHGHRGYWCGDKYALDDFEIFISRKYKNITKLNEAWNQNFESFKRVMPLIPDRHKTHRGFLDQTEWYFNSMNNWVDFWLKTARNIFNDIEINICTGGSGAPPEGAEFSKQTKIASKYKCGVRITNEMTDYLNNFIYTKIVSTAGRFYNTYFCYEPAGRVYQEGIIGRLYNAAATGAHLHDYAGNYMNDQDLSLKSKSVEIFTDNYKYCRLNKPEVKTAVMLPIDYLSVNIIPEWGYPYAVEQFMKELRKITDYDIIDENLILDGALEKYDYLVFGPGNSYNKKIFGKIEAWLEEYKILISFYDSWFYGNNENWLKPVIAKFTGISRIYQPEYYHQEHINLNKNKGFENIINTQQGCSKIFNGLDKDTQIIGSSERGAIIWRKMIKNGSSFFFAGSWEKERNMYLAFIKDILFFGSDFDSKLKTLNKRLLQKENIFKTALQDKILTLDVKKQIITETD